MFPYERVWHLKNCQKSKFANGFLKFAQTVDDIVIYNCENFKKFDADFGDFCITFLYFFSLRI